MNEHQRAFTRSRRQLVRVFIGTIHMGWWKINPNIIFGVCTWQKSTEINCSKTIVFEVIRQRLSGTEFAQRT